MSTQLPSFKSVINNLCLPSLEDLSMLSIVIYLLEQDNVMKILVEHFSVNSPSSSLPNGRISRIIKACKSVQIPDVLESKFLNCIQWVLDSYMEWIFNFIINAQLSSRFNLKKDFVKYIANAVKWDSNLNVDYQASVHELLNNPNKKGGNLLHFKIACEYCSEDDVWSLWSKLSAPERKAIFEIKEWSAKNVLQLYWACVMCGEMGKFLQFFSEYVDFKGGEYRKVIDVNANIFLNAYDCGFIIAVLEGSSAAIKYFSQKFTCIDNECLLYIIEQFIVRTGYGWIFTNESVDSLCFLLNKIKDDELLSRFFNKNFMPFMRLGVKYWPCHKYIVELVEMNPDKLDHVLLLDLMTDLLADIWNKKMDIVLVKNLWRSISIELKKSFFSFICVKKENRKLREFWENVTIDIINLLLKEKEFRDVSTLHENNGLSELILAQKFDVVDHWLAKFFSSEQAVIEFMENHVITQSIEIIDSKPLNKANDFLNWAFKYEDVMNNDKVLRVKNEVIEKVCVKTFITNVKVHNRWNDLNKFVDWLFKGRNDYDDELINLKMKLFDTGKILFQGKDYYTVNHFNIFLKYGICNTDKLKSKINAIDFHENETCSKWLERKDWNSVNLLFYFLSEYGRNIFQMKQNIFNYIFSSEKENYFYDSEYWKSIDYVLDWSLKKDIDSVMVLKKEIWEIKKTVIDKYACKSLVKCIENGKRQGLINLLNCLFKERDECENYERIVYDLKKDVIKKLTKIDSLWEKKNHLSIVVELVNWGKDDEKIWQDIWSLKKYFIKILKDNVDIKAITSLFLREKKNFIPSIFKEHEDEKDFMEILWDLKECLIYKIVNSEFSKLTYQIFEEFEDFKQFLNWNGFSEVKLEGIKNLIFEKNGVNCCLHWIFEDKFNEIKRFIDWCTENSSNKELKIVQLKIDLLKEYICKYSKDFEPQNFQLDKLDQFLLIYYADVSKDLKKSIIEEFGAKGCCKRFLVGDLQEVSIFIKWAYEGNENIDELKENILKEIFNDESYIYWKKSYSDGHNDEKSNFIKNSNIFLYSYGNSDPKKICNMKLDLIEIHWNKIFTKLLSLKVHGCINNFLTWAFDQNTKNEEFLKTSKLIKEIFDKYGKEYYKLLLINYDSQAITDFWSLCMNQQYNHYNVKNMKMMLWQLKKECITETLISAINDGKFATIDTEWFWTCLTKFLSLKPVPPNFQKEVCEFKRMIKDKLGMDFIKKSLEAALNKRYSDPEFFLKWLFGVMGKANKAYLDGKILFDFKKEVLERLLVIENYIFLGEHAFYVFLTRILDFNTTDEMSIINLKKSVVEVQGVKLCIGLICQNDEAALQLFLSWLFKFYDDNALDFKRAVSTELANLTVEFSWEPFKFFLYFGFDFLNAEQDYNYEMLKSYVVESCGLDLCCNWTGKKKKKDVSEFLKWGFENEDENLMKFKNRLKEKLEGKLMEVV